MGVWAWGRTLGLRLAFSVPLPSAHTPTPPHSKVIAYVSGTLVAKNPEHAIVEAGGLGYRVEIPSSTFTTLPATGQSVKLHTYHYVREDALRLYGFATEAEREVFEVMTGVSRVGPKLALSALSSLSPAELRDHVIEGDTAVLTNISGVGKKTAERLIVELRDRFADVDLGGAAPLTGGSDDRAEARKDALAALQSLGLSKADAERAIRKVLRDNTAVASADALVRLALKER